VNIKHLEMLAAVATRGGYLAAGEHLHIAHSAVHRRVRLLEGAIGQKVFVRRGRTMKLTEAGQLLVNLALHIDSEVAAVESKIQELKKATMAKLRIGTGTTTLIFFLPPVLDELRIAHPHLEVQIMTGTAGQILRGIEAQTLDIALISEPTMESIRAGRLRSLPLFQEEFVLVVNKKHALANRRSICEQDLLDLRFIGYPKDSRLRALTDRALLTLTKAPRIDLELENEEAIVKMVELGFGAGFIARRRAERENLHILALPGPDVQLTVVAAYAMEATAKPLSSFVDLCLKHARSQDARAVGMSSPRKRPRVDELAEAM
jgi:LysR family cyn operon transcriptional activator